MLVRVHITRADALCIQEAEGWLELGNWREANEAIESLPAQFKAHPVVLQARINIYKAARKWDYIVEIALHLAGRFPTQHRYPYLLACCFAQLGDFEKSKAWFQRAMAVNEKTVQREAVIDHDLKPLWDSMSGSLWKRE